MRIGLLVLDSTAFHLLTAEVVAGRVEPLDDAPVSVRIDASAFAGRAVAAKAYEHGMTAIETLLERCKELPVGVATGSFREAANARVFLDEVTRRFGLHVGQLSGDAKARLASRGVGRSAS